MKFSASVQNSSVSHKTFLKVGEKEQSINIPPKLSGGSSVTGGELLLLALATCFCNDLYREAGKRNIKIESLEVYADGDFDSEGKPATNIRYHAKVKTEAGEEAVRELLKHTDTVAEVQNTLRAQNSVILDL
jgi:uncharacterized OsmC-like protein